MNRIMTSLADIEKDHNAARAELVSAQGSFMWLRLIKPNGSTLLESQAAEEDREYIGKTWCYTSDWADVLGFLLVASVYRPPGLVIVRASQGKVTDAYVDWIDQTLPVPLFSGLETIRPEDIGPELAATLSYLLHHWHQLPHKNSPPAP